jgi:hypothetical protein
MNRTRLLVPLALAAALTVPQTGLLAAESCTVDVEDVELSFLAAILAQQTGKKVVAHPDAAGERVTFAAKHLSRTGILRWVCRSCGLAATPGAGGAVVLGKPESDAPTVKSFTITSLLKTEPEAEALVAFIKAVPFVAFKNRTDDMRLDAKVEGGKLKVLAPRMVHREVLALLQAMSRAKKAGDQEAVAVDYASLDLGLLRSGTGAAPPPLKGSVSVDVQSVPAPRAAWKLTSKSDASFYVDPWDAALAERKVSLPAEEMLLADAANRLAKALGAELVPYDGAWVFVRAAQKPLYQGIDVRVRREDSAIMSRLNLTGWVRRLAGGRPTEGLPFAMERAGERLLISLPAGTADDLASAVDALTDWADDLRRRPGRFPPGFRRGPGGPGKGK